MPDGSTIFLWTYAASGVVILWGKLKASDRAVYGLTNILDRFVPPAYERLKLILEVAIYVFLGCYIAMGVLEPATPGQAFAAGLGWTGLTTTAMPRTRR